MRIVTPALYWLSLLRLWPLMLLCRLSPRRHFIREERRYWYRHILGTDRADNFCDNYRLFLLPEYRTVIYLRLGGIRRIVEWLAPGQRPLQISLRTEDIAMGFVLQHAHSTRIGAHSIGTDVQIWHNVTIGTSMPHSDLKPTIGNHVRIFTGAIVCGDIHIGDHATIAAGSVVLRNVPPHAVVAGNPARLIRLNDQPVCPPQKLE